MIYLSFFLFSWCGKGWRCRIFFDRYHWRQRNSGETRVEMLPDPFLGIYCCQSFDCLIALSKKIIYIKHERLCLITFQTVRGELKYHAQRNILIWRTSRCLEMWSNTVLSVWYVTSQSKVKLRRKQTNRIVRIYADEVQISKHGLDFLCLNSMNYQQVWES